MTFAEIERALASKQRVLKAQRKERAIMDYKLADLIGYSTARVHNSKNKMPSIEEMYPDLFLTEEVREEIQKKKEELSVLRFIQFTQNHNKKFKDGEIIG